MRIDIKIIKSIPKGMAILNDLDKMTYNMNPAAKENMAVLVPDWNMPQITNIPVKIKNSRSQLILLVMPNIINAAAAEAAWHPYVAASLNVLLVQQYAIEKWDGKLPIYSGGDNIPMINLGK